MQKLIKLSDTHYIAVDDSEKGKEGFNWNYALGKIDKLSRNYEKHSSEWSFCKKITHSTIPLEDKYIAYDETIMGDIVKSYHRIKPLSLSKVEEAIKDNSSENNEWNIYFDDDKIKLI